MQERKGWLRIKVKIKGDSEAARVEPEPFVSREQVGQQIQNLQDLVGALQINKGNASK